VNIDGRVIQTVKVVEPAGQSRLDWEVIRDLA
jgi:predicted molibdopterin-dependent oxidoreductase YjgC